MSLKQIGALSAIAATCALAAGCGSTSAGNTGATQAHITGSATFHERLALPPNAVFEALLEDVSRADARAVVLGQQNISPAGSPPYALNIPYNPAQISSSGRYNVRTTIRVNDRLWFTNDQAAPVLQGAGNTQVSVLMRRVAQHEQPPAPQVMPKPGSQAHGGASGALVPAALQHTWQVTHLAGKAISGKAPSLRFDGAEARVSGNTSCNNYSATYRAQATQLQFDAPMMTKMMCTPSHEAAFVTAMAQVRSQHLSGKTLHLLNAAGQTVLTANRP